MEGERRASPERSSGLPAGGAGGENPGDRSPLPGSSGSSALLQADVLDLDEDEDDLEVFSKVRAAAARPGKVPGQLQELATLWAAVPACSPCRGVAPSWKWVGSPDCLPGPRSAPHPALRAGRAPIHSRSLLCTLTFSGAGP